MYSFCDAFDLPNIISGMIYAWFESASAKKKMKKILPFLAALILLLYPAICFAVYIIELKNKAHFTTDHYWKEGNLIYFHAYDGVVGIPSDFIKNIKESSRLQPEKPSFPKKSKPLLEKTPSNSSLKNESAPLPSKNVENARKYMHEFVLLKKRFKDISSMKTEELLPFAKDLDQFRNKILAARLGHLYVDQFVETYAMGNKVEAILKERTH